jgi:hypothetical protein
MKHIILLCSFFLLSQGIQAQCFEPDASIWEDTWASCQESPNPISSYGDGHWIKYDFGSVRNLSKTWVWNTNEPGHLKSGFSQVQIDYSIDGTDWTNWGEMDFPMGTGEAIYGGFPGPDMVGLKARYVLITALSNHGHDSCYGIAEIKFNLLPQAEGGPEDSNYENCGPVEDFEVEILEENTVLLTWEAVEPHEEYLVEYRLAGTENWTAIEGDYDEAYLSELIPFETYEFRINTICFSDLATSEIGTFTLGTVSTKTEKAEELEYPLEVFPNPTRGNIGVVYQSDQTEDILYHIKAATGQLIQSGQIMHSGGRQVYQLYLDNLPDGVYYLQVLKNDKEFVGSERIVKISN